VICVLAQLKSANGVRHAQFDTADVWKMTSALAWSMPVAESIAAWTNPAPASFVS
jgi:hypothetical protein